MPKNPSISNYKKAEQSASNPYGTPSGGFSRASALINESISNQVIPQLNQ
jgi:hypothetical protein